LCLAARQGLTVQENNEIQRNRAVTGWRCRNEDEVSLDDSEL
jgi:hypothetical protein